MPQLPPETCWRCEKVIKGKAIAYVFEEHVVCSKCFREWERQRKQREREEELAKQEAEFARQCSHFFTKVVGVSFRNNDGSSRQKIIAQCKVGEPLNLIREVNNPHDRNAILVVRCNGSALGHLSADLSPDVIEWFAQGFKLGVFVSEITGGGRDEYYGCNLLIILVPAGVSEADVEAYGRDNPDVNSVVN